MTGSPGVAEGLDGLAAGWRWSPRRGLDSLAAGAEVAATLAEATAAGERLVVEEQGALVGSTTVTHNPWECERLGVDLVRLSTILTTGSDADRRRIATALLSQEATLPHDVAVLRVDADDQVTLVAAQDAGFVVHEATSSYLHRAVPQPEPIELTCEVTVHPSSDPPDLPETDRAALLQRADRFLSTHLGADPGFDPRRVGGLYRRWTEHVLDGDWGDLLVLARRDGAVAGLVSLTFDREVERAIGRPLLIGSFVLSSQPGSHALRDLVRVITTDRQIGADACEFVTPIRNVASNRGLQERPTIKVVRACYTLHRWRRPPRRSPR